MVHIFWLPFIQAQVQCEIPIISYAASSGICASNLRCEQGDSRDIKEQTFKVAYFLDGQS